MAEHDLLCIRFVGYTVRPHHRPPSSVRDAPKDASGTLPQTPACSAERS